MIAPLLLQTSGGNLTLRVRAVLCGDTYMDGRRRNDSLHTIVEFTVVGARGDRHLAAYDSLVLEGLLRDGFQPDSRNGASLDSRAVEQLRGWLDALANGSDGGPGELVALLVGDEDELRRASVALGRLQIECRTCAAGAALRELRASEPALLVVDGGQPGTEQLVEGLRAADGTVPLIVLGGDGASADGWLPQPVDGQKLVDLAAELLEFV